MRKIRLADYTSIIGQEKINEIKKAAKPLQSKHVVHVNSTFTGGGVAEILNSLVDLFNDVGIKTGWRILKGEPAFYNITKSFHNGLQGEKNIKLNKQIKDLYQEINYHNSIHTHLDHHDAVIIHDPHPLPLVQYYKRGNNPWIWRCHIDLVNPNKKLWNYLKTFIKEYDAVIVSDEKYLKADLKIKQKVINPSIDPLSHKNKNLSDKKISELLKKLNIPRDKPIISQISRFDKWKDPLGVIEAFDIIRKKINCRLVLLGNLASDDPEGLEIYDKVMAKTKHRKDIHVLLNVENNDLSVNALQRASAVVIQKSLKEGFALTVSEALWKGTPVVASNVGGIPLQIVDGQNGFLINNVKECAEKTIWLLENKKQEKQMSAFAKKYVRDNFLITRHLLDYFELLNEHFKK